MTITALASNPLACMIGGSVTSCLAVTAAIDPALRPEIVLGMAGPLASAVISWQVMERTQAAAPERLTGVMMTAFAAKMVLIGAYVVVMLTVVGLQLKPFLASFTGYYVALHFVEALFLRRLLAGGPRSSGWSGR